MSIRKRLPVVGSILLVAALLVAYSSLHASKALAADNSGWHICWGANGTSYCMDLKDDTFQTGQQVYLWNANTGNGLGWNLANLGTVSSKGPFTIPSLNTRYNGDSYYYLEKTTSTGHNGCIGFNQSTGGLAWYNCGDTTTEWVYSASGYLVNVYESDFFGDPRAAAACSIGNGAFLGLGDPLAPGGQCTGPWNAFPV